MDEIESQLAETDPDRYVANFFAPASARPGLAALYAFDNEVARIGLSVREPMVGHIRLAWWREQIAAIYAGEAVHAPVSKALAAAVKRWQPPRLLFDSYVNARACDLDEAPFADETAFETSARQTAGSILLLALRVLGADHRAEAAVQHTAPAIAYRTALREFQAARAVRRYRQPVAWLESAGLAVEDALADDASPELGIVTAKARERIDRCLARTNGARFRLKAMPALAVATLARIAFDPFQPVELTPWQRASRLALANLMWRV